MIIMRTIFQKNRIFIIVILLVLSCSKQKNEDASTENESLQNHVVELIQQRAENAILVCAHRGYHQFAPENSLEAIQKAMEANIDIVEVDVNTTKDGVFILMHDDKIDRTTNGTGYVSDYTFLELKALNLKINDSVTSHKIPTLVEVLELAKGEVILNLDIKNVDVASFHTLLRSRQMQHDVFSFIWDEEKIEEMLAIDSTYAVLPLVSSSEEMMYYAENLTSNLQHYDEQSFTNENMEWADENGISVFMNSLWQIDDAFIQNDTQPMDAIIELKPAIIQTDYPVELINYLKIKDLHE